MLYITNMQPRGMEYLEVILLYIIKIEGYTRLGISDVLGGMQTSDSCY